MHTNALANSIVASSPNTVLFSDEHLMHNGWQKQESVNVLDRLQKFQSASSLWILKSKFNSSSTHFQVMTKGGKSVNQ